MTEKFVDGLGKDSIASQAEKRPVRNQVAQAGEEISALRYWKVRKGSYPEIRRLSEESIWPFFEKTGARIMGMWKVEPPPGQDGPSDYDEVYLLTRYASFAHWKATRDMVGLGGNGPDFEAAIDAVRKRQELATETRVTFLKGGSSDGRPYFMPGLGERNEESERRDVRK